MDASANAVADTDRAEPLGFFGLCLSLFGLVAAALVLTALIVGIVVGVAGLAMGWSVMLDTLSGAARDGDLANRLVFVVVCIFYMCVAASIFIAARWRGGAKWRDLVAWRGFRAADWRIWAIMVLALVYSAAASVVMAHFMPHATAQLTVPTDRVAAAALLALAVLIAPLTEELMFRGWIYTALRIKAGLWPALLISSALFALAHYDKTHFYALAVFPLGIALGLIRERTGSIRPSILFHAINNLAAFCVAAMTGG